MPNIFDAFPDLRLRPACSAKTRLCAGSAVKNLSKRDAHKLLAQAALCVELEDYEGATFYHNLSLEVLLRARANGKSGVETERPPVQENNSFSRKNNSFRQRVDRPLIGSVIPTNGVTHDHRHFRRLRSRGRIREGDRRLSSQRRPLSQTT